MTTEVNVEERIERLEASINKRFNVKFSKIWMVVLETMLLLLILNALWWFNSGLDYIEEGQTEKGKLIVDATKTAIGSLGGIAGIIGGIIPALIGMFRVVNRSMDQWKETRTPRINE